MHCTCTSRSETSPIPFEGTPPAEVPKKSVIWEYYIKTGADSAICKTCNRFELISSFCRVSHLLMVLG